MKLARIATATVLCFLLSPAARAANVLEPVDYHGDEVTAKASQSWLGLYTNENGKAELKPTKITITMVNDQIIDEDPKLKTGKRVAVPGAQKPRFLLSGIPGLKAGPVVTSPINKKEHLEVGEQLKLKVGTSEATLTVAGKKNKEYRNNYTITLTSGGTKQQILRHKQIGADTAPSLLWCGDLDGDGKIDLIMDTTDNYNVSNVAVFLSGKAKPGSLVKKVAEQFATGC